MFKQYRFCREFVSRDLTFEGKEFYYFYLDLLVAGVAKLVYALDSKSSVHWICRFDSDLRHQIFFSVKRQK